MSVPAFLAVLLGTVLAVLGAGAFAGWIVAELLNERDRRRQ